MIIIVLYDIIYLLVNSPYLRIKKYIVIALNAR